MRTVILTHVKSLPGFDRQCYKGDDGKYYVFQNGQWLSASKDWEPCCPITNIIFKVEANT
jgi:hypothetical protein